MNDDDGVRWWSPEDIFDWAVTRPRLRLSGRVPLRYWPALDYEASYLGTMDLERAVATRWQTPTGIVALVWPLADSRRRSLKRWAQEVSPQGDGAVILVTSMFFRGPDIDGFLPGNPEDGDYSPIWADVARALGTAVPYWPPALRQPDLIRAWLPGAEPVTTLARGSIDSEPLLQLAATYPRDDSRATVLINLAQRVNLMAHREAEFALERLDDYDDLDPEHLIVAARPVAVPHADRDDLAPVLRKSAWRDIQARSDVLASTVVRLYTDVDGGTDLAAGHALRIDPAESEWAREWAGRLQPCARTAAHHLLADGPDDESMIDPETDAAVVRQQDGTLVAAIPQRLPARAPLQELILDEPIWIRTADRVIWPAPLDSYFGLSWGYAGSGPGTLALLIAALLDDINAQAAADINGAPAGLEKLTMTRLPAGTVLSRDDLLAAREDRWMPVFTADDEDDDR